MRKFLMRRRNRILFISCMFLLALLCIFLMAYPALSADYNESIQSQIHAEYEKEVNSINTEALEEMRKAAEVYNNDLYRGKFSLLSPEASGYYDQMRITDSKIMCYVRIPKINILLPVFHGIGDEALKNGAGHMPQSSLPVGGINSHAVISAHTGMASGPMFTDLEMLKPGDTFQILVLGETLTYEIQTEKDIQIVLPQQIDAIQIRKGEDLITLVTCTPYGVNSHRLLVTGHRIETLTVNESADTETLPVETAETSVYQREYQKSIITGIVTGAFILLVGSGVLLLSKSCLSRKGDGSNEEHKQ